jgi:WD repeat-containing protein 55
MYDTVCTLPLNADLFAQAVSPREPLLAVGLASGHVQCFKLPPESSAGASNDDDDDDNENDENDTNGETIAASNGYGLVESVWRTRRHKGSCRTLWFSMDGERLVSAGTDGIVKVALCETGRVEEKIAIPADPYVNIFPAQSFRFRVLQFQVSLLFLLRFLSAL